MLWQEEGMRRLIAPLLLLVAALAAPPPAGAEEVMGNRIFVEFAYDASTPELEAAERWGRAYFAKAKAAGRPVRLSVARSRGTTLISFESVAICDRVKACPLLVFRDLTARPVLETTAFQNVLIEYRGQEVFVVIRLWETTTECRLVNTGRAKCRKAPPKNAK
jgi:hypothetical protein